MEGFSGRASLLYHHPAHPHQPDREGPRGRAGGLDRCAASPLPGEHEGCSAIRRCGQGPDPAVLQPGRDLRRRPPGGGHDPLLPQRRSGRDALRPRGPGHAGNDLRADRLRPRRLPGHPHRHHLPRHPGRGRGPADAVGRVAIGHRPAQALPQRLRAAARALPVLRARPPPASRDGPPHRCRRLRHRGQDPRPGHRLHYQHHPFDLVGWDGHLWPFAFNISDFEPITGRVHQPPPVHLTFQPRNYVICSFVPRKFDYHPLAIPAPSTTRTSTATRSSTTWPATS